MICVLDAAHALSVMRSFCSIVKKRNKADLFCLLAQNRGDLSAVGWHVVD